MLTPETGLKKLSQLEGKEKICRNRGGESCAFDGAMIVLSPIADAAHLVHGPITCCANSWNTRGTLSSQGIFHKMGFTTDINELDVIFGSEDKLYCAIVETYLKTKPSAIFVYATCLSGLIGCDLEGVCRKAEKALGIKVVPINAPGFVGPKNLGNRIAGEALLEHVIGTEEPPLIHENAVNIIGEYNIAGDLWLIEPLLAQAGINILSRITGNSTFREIRWAHRAKLNVIICSRSLVNIGKEMQRRYGIPFIEVSFFGKTEIAKALKSIALKLNKAKLLEKVELLISQKEKELEQRLKAYKDIQGKKVVLYSGGVKSWSMISALKDLGLEVVAVGLKKSTHENEKKIKELVDKNCILFENTSPANILTLMKEQKADILIGGGRNQYLAIKYGFPFVDVNQERHIAYAGYDGLINLAKEIRKTLNFYYIKKAITNTLETAVMKNDNVLINPLKNSPLIGAVIAFQGIDKAVPVLHTCQGCNFLSKVLLIKHFREPISMVTTKLFTEDVVMSGEEKLLKTLQELGKKKAELIGIITGGLAEVKGENIPMTIARVDFPYKPSKILHIPIPDYEGGLEEGYAKVIEKIITEIPQKKSETVRGQINVISGSHLTPADFSELREIFESFGLKPIILPDLSFLDGSREFSSIAIGGITLKEIENMANSEFTIVIGPSLEQAGEILRERFDIEYSLIDSLNGLHAFDRFLELLSLISDRNTPEKYLRQRRVLIDGMRDVQVYLTDKRVAIALETDLAIQTSRWLNELKVEVDLAVVPVKTERVKKINAKHKVIGSLWDIKGEFDLLISNSYAQQIAKEIGIPLYEMGFPVYKTIGYPNKTTIGYMGTLSLINEVANLMIKEGKI